MFNILYRALVTIFLCLVATLCYYTFFRSGILGVVKLLFLLFIMYMSLKSNLFALINYLYNALFFKNYTFSMARLEDLSAINYALEIFSNTGTQLTILVCILSYKVLKLGVQLIFYEI